MYHAGEVFVQQRMGQSDLAVRVGKIIRPDIPEAAAAFLREQPMVFVAASDEHHRLWASQIIGVPGFAHAVDAETIAIDARPVEDDPLATALKTPTRVGLLALQPQRRRRMRANGTSEPTAAGIVITTEQVYSNCPKYISRRTVRDVVASLPGVARVSRELNHAQQQWISRSDAFIVATADRDGNADASHRGGNPGFVQVLSPGTLRWPDYRGNSMFMTLGNLHEHPQCGLLIPDWRTGATLQLSGTAEINWAEGVAEGAQCAVDFHISDVVEIPDAAPLRWSTPELSPANPAL